MSNIRTQEDMFAMIELWLESGVSQLEFCQKMDIAKSSFGYWRKKYLRRGDMSPAGFKEIKPVGSHISCEVVFPNGVKVIVNRADIGFIRALVF